MSSSTCHCGKTADVLVMVLKDAEPPGFAEHTWASCFQHLPEVMVTMEAKRAGIDGIMRVRSERRSAYTHAWFMIDQCPHVLHTPEWAICLRLAKEHEAGHLWVRPEQVQHGHGGGSLTHVTDLLRRPRLAGKGKPHANAAPMRDWTLVEEREIDGVAHFRLAGWEGP